MFHLHVARLGELPEFTGVSAPYETPENPELLVDTSRETLVSSREKLVDYVVLRGPFGEQGVPGLSPARTRRG